MYEKFLVKFRDFKTKLLNFAFDGFLRHKLQIFFLNHSWCDTVRIFFLSSFPSMGFTSLCTFLWLLSFIFRIQATQKKLHRTPVHTQSKPRVQWTAFQMQHSLLPTVQQLLKLLTVLRCTLQSSIYSRGLCCSACHL